jgi:tetratricopeptide (TPR) repeat protein
MVDIWDLTVSPEERRNWQSQALVESLFHEHLFRTEVIEQLRTHPTASKTVRNLALQMAQVYPEDPDDLSQASWKVVKLPGAEAKAYRVALKQAEAASRIAPDNAAYLGTLGVALYRVGKYDQAREVLLHADNLYAAANNNDSHPRDLAFLAQAHHHLGQANESRAVLGRLRQSMKSSEWDTDDYWRCCLLEAEALIRGKRP